MNDETAPENKNPPVPQEGSSGLCAAAAAKAALTALITGEFPDPVGIILPRGEVPWFQLAYEGHGEGYAMAGIVMDADGGAHGATVIATVFPAPPGTGIVFHAGEGVGTVTHPGLPIPPGEAAIDPPTRRLTGEICAQICAEHGLPADLAVTISVTGGGEIENPPPGIDGGIAIVANAGKAASGIG